MPRILPIVFSITGLVMLAVAGFATKDTLDLRAVAERVPGRVVGVATSTSDDGTSYAPIYEFELRGDSYRHEATVSTSDRPTIGATQTLLVDPSDPTEVKPDTYMGQWFFTTLFGGMGIVFTGIGVVLALVRLASRRAPRAEHAATVSTTDHDEHDPFVGRDDPSSSSGPFL